MRAFVCLAAVAALGAGSAAQAQVVAAPRGMQTPRAAPAITVSTYQVVEVRSASDTAAEKSVSGKCPAGMKAFSGSANGRSDNPPPSNANDDGVVVKPPQSLFGYSRGLSDVVSRPSADGAGWSASGRLANANGPWAIELTIVCGRI